LKKSILPFVPYLFDNETYIFNRFSVWASGRSW
jgi:hypothetical protein